MGEAVAVVRVETEGRVRRLVLQRPEQLNAFTVDTYRQLRVALGEATADDRVGAVVLAAEGRAFSAGADRSLVDGSAGREVMAEAAEEFPAVLAAIDACELPVLAAVNGLAVGLGATILLHCDLVVMAESARLRFPFTALGIVPEAGSSVLLPARGPWGAVAWALLSSEWVDAAEALRLGVAWRVVPDDRLDAEVAEAATTLAALDRDAVTATKRLLVAGRAEAVAGALAREGAEMGALLRARRADPRPDEPDA